MAPDITDARPLQIRIADDLRALIETRRLAPGSQLPTLGELSRVYACSLAAARKAVELLRQQGLVNSVQGRGTFVRVTTPRTARSNHRYQEEKDLVGLSESERRRRQGDDPELGVSSAAPRLSVYYDEVHAGDLAEVFGIDRLTVLVRRSYETTEPISGRRRSWRVSYLPRVLIETNPALLDPSREPWPGGTQHQLSTVGVEIVRVVDAVVASMPTTADAQLWNLDDGVPLLHVRRVCSDTSGRIVEVSDIDYPADTTELLFTTTLRAWTAPTTGRDWADLRAALAH